MKQFYLNNLILKMMIILSAMNEKWSAPIIWAQATPTNKNWRHSGRNTMNAAVFS